MGDFTYYDGSHVRGNVVTLMHRVGSAGKRRTVKRRRGAPGDFGRAVLKGCGLSRERRGATVERTRYLTGPVMACVLGAAILGAGITHADYRRQSLSYDDTVKALFPAAEAAVEHPIIGGTWPAHRAAEHLFEQCGWSRVQVGEWLLRLGL